MKLASLSIVGVFPIQQVNSQVKRVLDVTQSLSDQFGSTLVTAPSAELPTVESFSTETLEPLDSEEIAAETEQGEAEVSRIAAPKKAAKKRDLSLDDVLKSFVQPRPWLDQKKNDAWHSTERRDRQSHYKNSRRGSGLLRK